MKKKIAILMIAMLMILTLTACSSDDSLVTGTNAGISSKATAENDTAIGLKNIKIDNDSLELSEENLAVLTYYDNDYFDVSEYEYLARYPQIFEGAQVSVQGIVKKVMASDSDEYQIMLQLVLDEDRLWLSEGRTDYEQYLAEHENDLLVIKGTQQDVQFIEGDYIYAYGRYVSKDSYTVDNTDHVLPTINAYKAYIHKDTDFLTAPEKYDYNFIRQVAKTVFGNNVEIREPLADQDFEGVDGEEYYIEHPFFIAELENQSNAKFSKYRMYTQRGLIEDAKSANADGLVGTNENMIRELQFSADFEHYFLFTFDTSLGMLTLDYYDKQLNKIWTREFPETTSAVYDYTESNIYLVANNELNIINIETGENTFDPVFVGKKIEVRKLADGILLIADDVSDTFMKTDCSGNLLWKTNWQNGYDSGSIGTGICYVQLIEDKIITEWGSSMFVTVDNETGELLSEAELFNSGIDDSVYADEELY